MKIHEYGHTVALYDKKNKKLNHLQPSLQQVFAWTWADLFDLNIYRLEILKHNGAIYQLTMYREFTYMCFWEGGFWKPLWFAIANRKYLAMLHSLQILEHSKPEAYAEYEKTFAAYTTEYSREANYYEV